VLGLSACMLAAVGCTSSPVSDQGIVTGSRELTGRVVLSDGSSPDGIYVWLEGTNIATRTDGAGSFLITLPQTSEGGSQIAAGAFNLFFYVANFRLAAAHVIVQNGEFLRARGDINPEGELKEELRLFKILSVRTLVDPASVPSDFEGSIDIEVTLQATLDTVTVVFPKMVGGLLGAIVLRNLGTGDVFVDVPDTTGQARAVERVGPEPRSWRMVLDLRRGMLPPGEYEVVPYFLIEQDDLPPALLASLGPDVQELGPGYLEIPFKREGGRFVIIADQDNGL